MSKGSGQCFKYYPGFVSWEAARNRCQTEGLQMAMPANDVVAVALRKDIFHIYGTYITFGLVNICNFIKHPVYLLIIRQ